MLSNEKYVQKLFLSDYKLVCPDLIKIFTLYIQVDMK